MGFWQNLAESYEKNADTLKITHPLSASSIAKNADFVVISINGNSTFIKAEKYESDEHIPIPVTEDSASRSSTMYAPHPVFDQYGYVSGKKKPPKAKKKKVQVKDYLTQLRELSESQYATESMKVIYKYVANGTIVNDLKSSKVKEDTNILFNVEFAGNAQTMTWKDPAFFTAWHLYYCSQKGTELQLDYMTGQKQTVGTKHPRRIINKTKDSWKAKLISFNDSTNFTFRGKFQNSEQAFSIGYESSQKAHQFLRYLIESRGFFCGEQVILSYTIAKQDKVLPILNDTKSIFDAFDSKDEALQTEADKWEMLRTKTGVNYSEALKKALDGYKHDGILTEHYRTAVIALDAATKGRYSITFYRELDRGQYLDKLADWHITCQWHRKFNDKKNKRYVPYIGSPSVDDIIKVVYGEPRGGQDKSYEKIKKAARERLLRCIFDGDLLPPDYVAAAVRRVSNPMSIVKGKEFDRNIFERFLSTTCALVRVHYLQQRKEEYTLSIDMKRKDRDYLYGRLLGAADKLEEYALRKKGKKRETAAIRYMQNFVQRPSQTLNTIVYCLAPYFQTVKDSIAWKEFQAIYQQFINGENGNMGEFESKEPLNESYILGYYHERAEIDRLQYERAIKRNANKKQENEDGTHQ